MERDLRAGQATWRRERGIHLVRFLRWTHARAYPLDVVEQEGTTAIPLLRCSHATGTLQIGERRILFIYALLAIQYVLSAIYA